MTEEQLSTEQIERRFDLHQRMRAVSTIVHARDYILRGEGERGFGVQVNAAELLADAIKNALDGRATGTEWRNVRWTYNNERDGPNPPVPKVRRCQMCGYIEPRPFEHCYEHRSAPVTEPRP